MAADEKDKKPFHNPFEALRGQRDALPPGPAPRAAVDPKGPARAVVRIERTGRHGKEVTVVARLGLPSSALDVWLKALQQALGCGGTVEGDELVLQGDHRQRLPPLLTRRGVRKVTVG